MLKANEKSVPVYAGQTRPLVPTKNEEKDFWYGRDGFSDVPNVFPTSDSVSDAQIESKLAAVALVELIRAHPNEIELVAVGTRVRNQIIYWFNPCHIGQDRIF